MLRSLDARQLISRQTPTGTGTVTFAAIPQYFQDLEIVLNGRGTVVATNAVVIIHFNGDTTGNYDYEFLQATAALAQGGGALATSSPTVANVCGSTAPAGASGIARIYIPNYSGTTFQKSSLTLSNAKVNTATTAGIFLQSYSVWWRNTAAITQIELILAANNWDTGSIVSLYGQP